MTAAASNTRRTIQISLAAMGFLLVLLLLMGTVFRISGAVIAPGDVSVESRIKQITHPTGGVISQILVKDGQKVRKGDLLLRLDTSVSGISSAAAGESLQNMLERRARLEAERDGHSSAIGNINIADKEKMLFDLRRHSLEESHAQMRERMRQAEQETKSIESQIRSVEQQKQLVEKERKGIQDLYNKGLVTITRYTQTERTAIDLDAQIDGLRARLAQARAQLAEIRQRDSQIDKDFRSQAGDELASLNAQMGDLQAKAASTADQRRRSEIRAPYNGVIDKLAYATVGAFMPAGQVVLEIVPDADRNLVSVRIAPQDIDQIKEAQPATLHFTAFSQQTTPTISGKVQWVSAERATDPITGATYYRAHIGLTDRDVSRLSRFKVKIGMPVDAYVETESRTILSYIFKPLMDQTMRAFR